MSKLSEAIARFRREVRNREVVAANAMSREYSSVYANISRSLDELTQEMSRTGSLSRSKLLRMYRYQALLEQVERELNRFVPFASREIGEASVAAVQMAGTHSQELIRTAPGPLPDGKEIPDNFTKFNPRSIEELAGRTAAGSPVRKLLETLPGKAVKVTREILLRSAVAGESPVKAAKALRDELKIPLTRAETIARTEILGAYREASIQTYKESEVVSGWRWTAALNARTCVMCIAMDGRVFPNSTKFGSHPNCRCTPVPEMPSWADLLGDPSIPDTRPNLTQGEDWFKRQPASIRKKMLGPTKFQMMEDGELTLEDLIAYRVDKDWGPNRWERSIRHIKDGKYKPNKRALGRTS